MTLESLQKALEVAFSGIPLDWQDYFDIEQKPVPHVVIEPTKEDFHYWVPRDDLRYLNSRVLLNLVVDVHNACSETPF